MIWAIDDIAAFQAAFTPAGEPDQAAIDTYLARTHRRVQPPKRGMIMSGVLSRILVENGSFSLTFEHGAVLTKTIRVYIDQRGGGYGVRQYTEEQYKGGLRGPARSAIEDVGPVFADYDAALPALALTLHDMLSKAEVYNNSLYEEYRRLERADHKATLARLSEDDNV